MKGTTPIATTTAAALSRVLDNVPKGYSRYTTGTIKVEKVRALAQKFHERHAIGASSSQRHTRKKHGRANALLTVYCPPYLNTAHWLLLFTQGTLDTHEILREVTEKPRLIWLGYELVRHAFYGKTNWTWRREKAEMEGLFGLLVELCSRRDYRKVQETLEKAARQPGFHGVRGQTWRLCEEAKRRGYTGPIPHLFFMQKHSHGARMKLSAYEVTKRNKGKARQTLLNQSA